MKTTATIKRQVQKIRQVAIRGIIGVLERHEVTELSCVETEDCPVVQEYYCEDDNLTLDSIRLTGVTGVEFFCSNNYDNDWIDASVINTDTLIDIWEWLLCNEDYFFEDYDK